jgi:hypothetical protein
MLDLRKFLVRKKTKSQKILGPQSVNPQIAKFAKVPNLRICGPPTFTNNKAGFQFSIQLSSAKEDRYHSWKEEGIFLVHVISIIYVDC